MNNAWKDFLNPDILRARLLRVGLFLVAHEILLGSIKDRLSDFFSSSWSADEGWKPSPSYRKEVLSLDPKGKDDALRGSIVWLRKMNVIDQTDEVSIRELTQERNRLAHELRSIIGGEIQNDFLNLFPRLVRTIEKIDRWWVVNVELDTDPDVMGQDIDEKNVRPGSVSLLKILEKVALGENDEAWELFRALYENREGKVH